MRTMRRMRRRRRRKKGNVVGRVLRAMKSVAFV